VRSARKVAQQLERARVNLPEIQDPRRRVSYKVRRGDIQMAVLSTGEPSNSRREGRSESRGKPEYNSMSSLEIAHLHLISQPPVLSRGRDSQISETRT